MTDREQELEFKIKSLTQERDHGKEKSDIGERGFNDQKDYIDTYNAILKEREKQSIKNSMMVHYVLIAIGIMFLFFPLYIWAILGTGEWHYLAVTAIGILSTVVNALALKRLKKEVKRYE